jgi:adenosylmethionine-8-amino-7-oxononanoate aminotransferase
VLSSDRIYDAFYADDTARGFLHSHSYTGNALACRAALAVLDIFRDDDVIATNAAKAARWRAMTAPLAAHGRVRGLRQCGMIIAFDVDGTDAGFATRFAAEALRRGLVLRPIGSTVYFMPPYTLTDDEFALLVERTVQVIDAT